MAIKKEEAVRYEVLEKCGVLGKRGSYNLELRYVSWNGNAPRYDLRAWGTDKEGNEKCGKGFTLSGDELDALGDLIEKMRKEK